MNLQMSDTEIVRIYKQAKDKNKQIEILADLNLCEKDDILELLTKNNAITGLKKSKKKRKAPIKWTQETIDELCRLHEDGLSLKQIAERMGLDELQVKNKLYRMNPEQKIWTEPETQEMQSVDKETPLPVELKELLTGLKIAFGIADSMSAVNFELLSRSDSMAAMAISLREYLRQLCDEAESMDKQHKKSPARSWHSQRREREESRKLNY